MTAFEHLTEDMVNILMSEFDDYLSEESLEHIAILFKCFDDFIKAGKESGKYMSDEVIMCLFLGFIGGFEAGLIFGDYGYEEDKSNLH